MLSCYNRLLNSHALKTTLDLIGFFGVIFSKMDFPTSCWKGSQPVALAHQMLKIHRGFTDLCMFKLDHPPWDRRANVWVAGGINNQL
jgi:hypothetical protein